MAAHENQRQKEIGFVGIAAAVVIQIHSQLFFDSDLLGSV